MAEPKKPAKADRKSTAYVVYEHKQVTLVDPQAGQTDQPFKAFVELATVSTNRGPQHAITLALQADGRDKDEGAFMAVPGSSAKLHKRTIKVVHEPRWNQEELS